MTAFTYDHIHLRSPDAEATARWYENMFGAEVIRSVQSDGRPRLDLNLGGVAVFIAQVPPEQAVAAPPEPPYLGLEHIEACVSTGLTRPSPSSSKRVPNSPWSPRRSGPGFGSLFFAARRTSTSNCWTGTPPDTFPAPRAGPDPHSPRCPRHPLPQRRGGATAQSSSPAPRDTGGGPPEPDLGQTHPDGFGAFATLGNIDQHPLAFIEDGDPGSLEHRGMDESILAAIVANDEAEPLLGVEPLHRAGLFDSLLGGEWCTASCRRISRPARRRRRRRAAVDTEDFGDLRSLLSRRHTDFERFTRLHRGDAVAFEHAGMQERVPRTIRQLDKPEASLGFEPFDDGAYRRAGWCFEARLAEARSGAKFAEMRVIPVVVKIAAPGLTKIPISDQVSFLSSRFTARSDRRNRLFQKIDAGASGLIVTMTMSPKPTGLPILHPRAQPVTALRDVQPRLAAATPAIRRNSFCRSLKQRPNVKSRTGRPVKRRVN